MRASGWFSLVFGRWSSVNSCFPRHSRTPAVTLTLLLPFPLSRCHSRYLAVILVLSLSFCAPAVIPAEAGIHPTAALPDRPHR